jgi:hypothetical protein
MKAAEVLAAVLQPALAMVQESTLIEYEKVILPTFKYGNFKRIKYANLVTF